MTLEYKIYLAEKEIIKHYELNNGNIFISFSGGKDSTVLRHIALRLYPDLAVVFSDTTNELTEIYKYIKTFDNINKVHPIMSFTNVIKKHGFPLVSKEVSQKVYDLKHSQGKRTKNTRLYGDEKGNGRLSTKWLFLAEQKFDVTHKCCKILKKDPLDKWAKRNNKKPLIAIMSGESSLREQLSRKQQEFYGDKIYPFLRTGWTDKDIWAYATKFNLRFAECYYEQNINGVIVPARDRTGCEFCGFGITMEKENRFDRSKIINPKRYNKIMNLKNNGVKFSEAIRLVMKKNLPSSLLGLYGYEIISFKEREYVIEIDIKHLHDKKKCKHCGFLSLRKKGIRTQNYFDLPIRGKRVKLNVQVQGYFCKNCKKFSQAYLPFISESHRMTDRLVEYIKSESLKQPFVHLASEIGLSEGIVRRISKTYEKL